MAVFYIYPCGREGYCFRMESNKGELILTSEVYGNSGLAYKAVRSVVVNKLEDENYQRVIVSGGECFFVFKASTGEVIGVSELLKHAGEMERMIGLVKRSAKVQKIFISL